MNKNLGLNDLCWCGSGKKYIECHLSQDIKAFEDRIKSDIIIKTPEQIEGIRKSGRLTTQILDLLDKKIQPGITTEEINQFVHEYTVQHGAKPAPLNYRGYPKSTCTSINEVVCHGIPDQTILQDGDIINVDVTCILDGYYADASRMYLVGKPSNEAHSLVQVTKECLDLGTEQVKPGNTFGDIGSVIQKHAKEHGYSVVRQFGGHGVGVRFHEEPFIPHFGKSGTGPVLEPDMIFTIEPMINLGGYQLKILSDGWTAVTRDKSLSAQWEYTVRVTENGYEILAR